MGIVEKTTVGVLAGVAIAGGLFVAGSAISANANGRTLVDEWKAWGEEQVVEDETTTEDEGTVDDGTVDEGTTEEGEATETLAVESNGQRVILSYSL